MASGDTMWVLYPQSSTPPATDAATFDVINDASTPNSTLVVFDFDGGGAEEHAEWHVVVPSHYSGDTGFTFTCNWAPDGTNSGDVVFELRMVKLTDSLLLTGDLGLDTATAASSTDTSNVTANDFHLSPTAALAKADAGTPAAGDSMIIRISRDSDIAGDTVTDDAQLLSVVITET